MGCFFNFSACPDFKNFANIIIETRMRKVLIFSIACCLGTASAFAAVRSDTAVVRVASNNTQSAQGASRAATPVLSSRASAQTGVSRTDAVSRTSGVVSRAASTTASRNGTAIVSRAASTTASRAATSRAATVSRAASGNTSRAASVSRSATGGTARSAISGGAISRAATSRAATISAATSNTFGTGYNACRDAYFTCMDQFCATLSDSYRRCICSSRLTDIQERERALSDTSDQLQTFTDFNIDAISKTAGEVTAMSTATAGEAVAATAKDTSSSAKALSGIVDVLSGTKSKALSTQGTLDIAGDIDAIWSTTDLTSGASISNLTGESLYNAVHAQCSQLVADTCNSSATLKMVMSAYGMYIENDCTLLSNALDKKLTSANSQIRATEREMNVARLENYNAHNSTSINDCVANVRTDLTADTACGKDFVHCLDITGRYLNRTTGEPIYSADFYQLDYQTSLSGDILSNNTNTAIIEKLNSMRTYAKTSLDKCSDLSDDVWNEFLRQAVREIYQGQQARIRQVKNECLDVVNECYDTQSKSIKDFSNIAEEKVLGMRLELAEEMCSEKLDACSNLYGGGAQGMDLLVAEVRQLTDQKIAQNCTGLLEQFVRETCAPSSSDSLHGYPYNCRMYAPGDVIYATNAECNQKSIAGVGGTSASPQTYSCPAQRIYVSCDEKKGYQLARYNSAANSYEAIFDNTPRSGNVCVKFENSSNMCGYNYVGSLLHKMVRYALEMCVRSSDKSDYVLPADILGDVVSTLDSVRAAMSKQLSAECERMDGSWVNQAQDASGTLDKFYDSTNANRNWGYCLQKNTVAQPANTNDEGE